MENKYSNGKIYKIIDNSNNNIYIGSTIFTLKQRLKGHISSFKRFNNGRSNNYYSSFEILKNHDFKIILIEKYSCFNLQELLKRESYFIDNMHCINKRKSHIEDIKQYMKEYLKEYRKTNKNKQKEYAKKYYQQNKELTLNIKIPPNTKVTINLNFEDEDYKKLEKEFEQHIKSN